MRHLPLLAVVLLAQCALPPRVDDRATPKGAYETFRGAMARGEHEREFESLSDRLRRKLGVTSRAEWQDARAVALTQSHIAVRAIRRSTVEGEPQVLEDGRVRLDLRLRYFLFSMEGRVWLRPIPVLRIYAEGEEHPEIHRHLGGLEVVAGPDGLALRVPDDVLLDFEEALAQSRRRITRFEARVEWFLDDYELGGETPAASRKEIESR
ncbi:MAG: hypothetical protein ACYTG3_00545 [Planctomycetota bacterium]